MAVRPYRGGYAPIGRFGWDGGSGCSACADPVNGVTGILLTQVGMSNPGPGPAGPRLLDQPLPGPRPVGNQ
ncbi:hypothetical protein GCM10022252_49100 [Streptosporangium oxazolinicum]|uniref:Uncharacterized protein n=2 Tax=Streptosporangium oxazolinicum TaxID=909287 RepID=A0ABP8B5A7_9ACTN